MSGAVEVSDAPVTGCLSLKEGMSMSGKHDTGYDSTSHVGVHCVIDPRRAHRNTHIARVGLCSIENKMAEQREADYTPEESREIRQTLNHRGVAYLNASSTINFNKI